MSDKKTQPSEQAIDQIAWSHELQKRLMVADDQGDDDLHNLLGEVACCLAALTGRPDTALAHQAAPEAPDSEVVDPSKPCRNVLLRVGYSAVPKTCPRCGLAKVCPMGHAPRGATPAATVDAQADTQQAGAVEICQRCQGSGEGKMLVGGGPDAYEIDSNCPDCGGIGEIATPAATTASASDFDAAWSKADESKQIEKKGIARYWFEAGRAPAQQTERVIGGQRWSKEADMMESWANSAQQTERMQPSREAVQVFTCKDKGGEYELIGYSNGAGPKRGESIIVYRDTTKPDILYHRSADDFKARMQWLGARAAQAAHAGADTERLNFLENAVMDHGTISAKRDRDPFVDSPSFGDLPTVTIFTVPSQHQQGVGLRGAIDAAMSSATDKKEQK